MYFLLICVTGDAVHGVCSPALHCDLSPHTDWTLGV